MYIIIAELPHIPISLLNFGDFCRIVFTSSANTPKTRWKGNLFVLAEEFLLTVIYLEHYYTRTDVGRR